MIVPPRQTPNWRRKRSSKNYELPNPEKARPSRVSGAASTSIFQKARPTRSASFRSPHGSLNFARELKQVLGYSVVHFAFSFVGSQIAEQGVFRRILTLQRTCRSSGPISACDPGCVKREISRSAENPLLRCSGAAVQYAPRAPGAGFRRNTFLCNLRGAAFLHSQDPKRT
jgi:hypothetical protein